MSTTKYSEPAFPGKSYYSDASGGVMSTHKGMSLRDWFAGQVLAGFCAVDDGTTFASRKFAEVVWNVADEMMAARDADGSREEGQ